MLLDGVNHVAILTNDTDRLLLSLFFRDPDGLEAEACMPNPAARPGVYNAPGSPAASRR